MRYYLLDAAGLRSLAMSNPSFANPMFAENRRMSYYSRPKNVVGYTKNTEISQLSVTYLGPECFCAAELPWNCFLHSAVFTKASVYKVLILLRKTASTFSKDYQLHCIFAHG
ncbi:hypothetical protein ScPMuIL_014213 [Solemya velum]